MMDPTNKLTIKEVTDPAFSASSTLGGYSAAARINSDRKWRPAVHKDKEHRPCWLQVDLGGTELVCGFQVQGGDIYWTTSIAFQVHVRDNEWLTIGVFGTNIDANTVHQQLLTVDMQVKTTKVRFMPRTVNDKWSYMRVAVLVRGGGADPGADLEVDSSGDLPMPSCSLTTELLRLRGGPYWTISYAWLRATPWARSVPYDNDRDDTDEGEPKMFCVDHETDGGGWVLVASYQSTHKHDAK